MPRPTGTTGTTGTAPPAKRPPPPPPRLSIPTILNHPVVPVAPPPRPPTVAPHTDIQSSGPSYGRARVTKYEQQTLRQPPTHTDITSSGPSYGRSRADAYKKSDAYKEAVLKVFQVQPAKQQQAIVNGALKNPKLPESKLILDYVKKNVAGPAGELSPIKAAITAPQIGAVYRATAGVPKGVLKVTENALKDLYNLPGGTVQGAYSLGRDIVTGHEGNAFHALVDPYAQLLKHPLRTFEQHPLNTALMFLGPKAIIGKGAGAVARSGLLGENVAKATSIAREPLHLGTIAGEASPITEYRYYSNDLFNQAVQKARERYLRNRGQNPNIARPAPAIIPESMRYAFNIGQHAKLQRRADELTSVRQQAGRLERAQALDAVRKAAPSKESRNIVSHVLQGVIRKPATAVADVQREIDRLRAAQHGLRPRSLDMLYNRRQVHDLEEALKTAPDRSGTPRALSEAFSAAKTLRPALHTQDAYLVSHGLLDADQALRARLFPYAQSHMGARYNPVTDRLEVPGGEGAARGEGGARAGGARPIATEEILAHLKKNGVPDPAYIGHFPGKVSPYRFYSAYKLARGTLSGAKGRTRPGV